MEYFYAPFECKADNTSDGTIFGYGSIFGNVDSYGDIVAPGAFAKTINDAKSGAKSWPAMLLQHGDDTADGKMPVGIWTDMSEDSKGLRLTGKLAINTERGKDVHELLKLGALNGLSIGFRCTDYEMHKANTGPNGARRTIKAASLVEISIVTHPSNLKARVLSVKSERDAEPKPVDENAWKRFAWESFEATRRLAEKR